MMEEKRLLHPEDEDEIADSEVARSVVRLLRRHISSERQKTERLMETCLLKVAAGVDRLRSELLEHLKAVEDSLEIVARDTARKGSEDKDELGSLG